MLTLLTPPPPDEEAAIAQRTRVEARLVRMRAAWEACESHRRDAAEAAEFLETDQAERLKQNPAESDEHWAGKVKIAMQDIENLAAKEWLETIRVDLEFMSQKP